MKELIIKIDEYVNMDIKDVEVTATPFHEECGKYVDVRVRVVIRLGDE